MTLLMTCVTFNMAQVFWRLVLILLCYLRSIDSSGWMAFSTTALVFLGGLGLRLISRRGGLRLSLVFILGSFIARLPIDILLIFFSRRAMIFWAPGINFLNIEGWL